MILRAASAARSRLDSFCHPRAKRAFTSDAPERSTTHFGFSTVRTADKQRMVSSVFTSVAPKYDLMNDLMSLGMHRVWKNHFVHQLAPNDSMSILDCATGTGDIARLIHARAPHATITLVDANAEMLQRAAERGPSEFRIVQANAQRLPFDSASFDAYTISFGMRNVPCPRLALEEAFRVLKPGGRFLMLEFSAVTDPFLQPLYEAYSFNVIPRIGQLVARDRRSYQYLVESIRAFPAQRQFADMIRDSGFRHVSVTDYTYGIAACYSAFKPAQ